MGLTGRIKVGKPGWLLAEGHPSAMEVFTYRIKNCHLKQLMVKWESTDTLPVGPYESPYKVFHNARLFPYGMFEVPANDFGKDLIAAGLDDALKMGTGLNFKHLYETGKGKGKGKAKDQGKGKGKGKGKKKH